MKKYFFIAILFSMGIWLVQCTNNVTGTSDETVIKSAKVFTHDLKPAQSVKVQVYKVDDTLRIPVYQTTTDNSGFYNVTVLKDFYYNVLIGNDESGAFQDSVLITSASILQNDTLGPTGVLRGKILLQPMDNPQTAIAQVVGTNKYVNVSENGQFIINGLPDGKYLLRSTSTKSEYTPTFSTFIINTAEKDTVDIEISLIYTGIPVVRNLKLYYDSLLNNVTLTWDTTNYFLFKTFQIYSLQNTDSKSEPFATSNNCSFSFQGGDPGDTGLFAVGIQSKSLIKGPVLEMTSVVYNAPVKTQFSETNNSVVESPYKLSIHVQNTGNKQIMYEWDIGATGNFVTTVSPDTTLTLNGDIIKQFTCVSRATIDNKISLLDTVTLMVSPGWVKSSEQKFLQQQTEEVVLKDSILYLFTIRPDIGDIQSLKYGDTTSVELWQSTDAITWQKVGSPAIPKEHSKPIIYKNMFCTADVNGHLWTSSDGLKWEQSANPICSTFVRYGSAKGPAGNLNYAPQLFSIGTRLYGKPNTGTIQADSIFFTEDFTSWKYAELSYSLNIADYVNSNNRTIILGYNWYDTEWRLGIVAGNHIENVPEPYQRTPEGYPPEEFSFSFYPSAYNCFVRGDYILTFTTGNPLYIWNMKLNNWVKIPLPKERFGQSYVFTSFKNTIYAVGTDGTFRMNID